MRSKQIELYKSSLKLSKRQREILVGTLLGDGHLETQNGGRTYRLKIEHSLKQQFYVSWLHEQFQFWVRTTPKNKVKFVQGKQVLNYGFQTLSVAQFRFYGFQFYGSSRKVIPKRVARWLTPLAVAVWFMDDGSYKSKQHHSLILNTHCYSRSELNKLIDIFDKKWDIEANLRPQKDGLQLMFNGPNAVKLKKLIEPFVLPEFSYKFGILNNTLPKK